jgi:hypothetical protein
MKLRVIAPLAPAATATAIGFAPIAAAAPTGTTNNTTVHEQPGNAQITVHPGVSSLLAAQLQQPFGGASNALIFHH